jgi:hypothetical protein
LKYILVLLLIIPSLGFAKNPLGSKGVITVSEAVKLLDENNNDWSAKVKGVFELTVNGTGKDKKWGYLNSSKNYRIKNSLTITLSKHIIKRLTKKYGEDPLEYLKGKTIRVKGQAKKAKIYKFENGKRTNLVYFQSHVELEAIKNIEIVN